MQILDPFFLFFFLQNVPCCFCVDLFLMTTMTTLPVFTSLFSFFRAKDSLRVFQLKSILLSLLVLAFFCFSTLFRLNFFSISKNLFCCCIKIYKQKFFLMAYSFSFLLYSFFFFAFSLCSATILFNAEKELQNAN